MRQLYPPWFHAFTAGEIVSSGTYFTNILLLFYPSHILCAYVHVGALRIMSIVVPGLDPKHVL